MKKLGYLHCALLFLFIGMSVSCTSAEKTDETEKKKSEVAEKSTFVAISEISMKDSEIATASARSESIRTILRLNGELSFNEEKLLRIHPRFAGVVRKISKKIGDIVNVGDILAEVQSNESLTRYNIVSDIEGTIVAKNIAVGEFAKEDQEIFTIADLRTVWVNAAVYGRDFQKVQLGQTAEVHFEPNGQTQDATVDYISPVLSKAARTQTIRLTLENSKGLWSPGMFVSLGVTLSASKVGVAVPVEAVVTIDKAQNVFVETKKENEKHGFEEREVTLGASDDKFTEIENGITEGEVVATTNAFILKAEIAKASIGEEE